MCSHYIVLAAFKGICQDVCEELLSQLSGRWLYVPANPRCRFGVLFITFALDILFFLLIKQKESMMTRRYLKM